LIVIRAVVGFFGFGLEATAFGFGLGFGEVEATAGLGLEEPEAVPEGFGWVETTGVDGLGELRLLLPPEPGGGVAGALVTRSFLAIRSGPASGGGFVRRPQRELGLSAHSST
jgi:hypothetical protein